MTYLNYVELKWNKKDCLLNICSQHSDINDSNFVNHITALQKLSDERFLLIKLAEF